MVPSRRQVLRLLPARTAQALRGTDLALMGAGVTFYAALSAVPLLIVAARLATAVVGIDRIRTLAETLSRALPSALGADRVAEQVVVQAGTVPWLVAAVCVLPATLYGEGLRRAFRAVDAHNRATTERMTGWRGRAALLPLLAVTPLLLLAILSLTPLLARLFSGGSAPTALGVYIALNVDWIVLALPLAYTFRVVAPDPPPLRAAVLGALATAAFLSGFLQGFVLFLSLPIDLGAPFGGAAAVGAVLALLLWLWLLHLVVLVGYVATVTAARLRRP